MLLNFEELQNKQKKVRLFLMQFNYVSDATIRLFLIDVDFCHSLLELSWSGLHQKRDFQ